MMKKSTVKKNVIINDDLSPIIEIFDTKNCISATYYNDLSGEISIADDYGDLIFFKDDGRLKHHIEYLNKEIKNLQKPITNKIKKYKKAILLLKKEQIKLKKKK